MVSGRTHVLYCIFTLSCLIALTCCGGEQSSLETSAPTEPLDSPCDTTCSAGAPTNLGSGVWRAQNASCGCINAAIQAASNNDTVQVPAGSYEWGNNVLSITKPVKVIGAGSAGTCGDPNTTCIRTTGPSFTVHTGAENAPFRFRLSGFKLTTTGNTIMFVQGSGKDWRIDNNIFEKASPKATLTIFAANGGNTWTLFGVIDSNIFKHVGIDLVGSTAAADHSWTSSAQWGTADAVFIENNTFYMQDTCGTTFNNSIDSSNGGRAVIRYNDFNDAYIMAHSACQMTVRGTRSYEIYNNRFNRTCPDFGGYVFLRAGSHVITDNLVSGEWYPSTGSAMADNRRSWFDPADLQNSQCTGYRTPSFCCTGKKVGTCSGSMDGFGDCNGQSPYDTNSSPNGYRCLDQPGAGTGAIGKQTLDPIYLWNNASGRICLGGANRWSTCNADSDCPGSSCSTQANTPNAVYLHNNSNYQPEHILSGRDYMENLAKPGYTKYPCPHYMTDAASCNSKAGRVGYIRQ